MRLFFTDYPGGGIPSVVQPGWSMFGVVGIGGEYGHTAHRQQLLCAVLRGFTEKARHRACGDLKQAAQFDEGGDVIDSVPEIASRYLADLKQNPSTTAHWLSEELPRVVVAAGASCVS